MVENQLAAFGIEFQAFEHPPLFTCEDADKLNLHRPGQRLKNLFLRDNAGKRHFLLITSAYKAVDLKLLSKQLKMSRLGFASSERLQKYLGIQPGSVSLLALLNDHRQQVELWIDSDLWNGEAFQCHPLVNTRTLVLEQADVEKFAQYTGHGYQLVDVPSIEE
ncbi:prolyl-tRNA synthetase associated domain-containing protein [Ferrimonas aestuarii]|uniref:Prolyl-tRNA synthetase associated domain-containing protein n=1 Tax=Ferrimonas aestuarii TaxID=2569539 RepID=A0A4U1BG59_9GAMM|nr:prolyl-tRNA synthetase associated domain-containing protein [Ferrimonas aestuarii]TKB50144.1 prolyl-tRNA synthetase associated domain-containing protein [Ferrimonas aestuarii]